ncbi:MAG TPA: DNA-directed RNA polymerase subunit beta [Thermodesulfobacteriota bacterium]|nr:DNA-directed RNA polymerase subunit beta [Thermodesulfobacteriota bacterium]
MRIDGIETHRLRKSFSKIPPVLEVPHLLHVQIKSYEDFLQADMRPDERKNSGLEQAFRIVFPIEDYNQKASLEYVSYRIDRPKYEANECRLKGYTYVAPLYVTFRLIIWEIPSDPNGERTIRDVKEQEIYFGEIPLMTPNGSFIINGTERVIVNQLHRSPGVFFDQVKGKDQAIGRASFSARIVPQDGRWMDFEFDSKGLLHVRIDRKKKFLVSVVLKALGYSDKEMMLYFYPTETVYFGHEGVKKSVNPEILSYQRTSVDIEDPKTGEIVVKKGRKFVRNLIEKLSRANIDKIPIELGDIVGRISADDIVDENTGEVIVGFNEEITDKKLQEIRTKGIKGLKVFYIDDLAISASLRNTIFADKVKSYEDAITEIYKKFRPTDPPTLSVAENFFQNMFFNPDTYRLSVVGRIKINHKLGRNVPEDMLTLTKEDIMETVRYLLNLKGGRGTIDDIDHLGNRRVRTVGELIEDRFYHGLERLARSVREKMSYQTVENLMPSELLIPKTVIAVVKEFFATGQLSQFMDQTNPLSEITHKRRLSALGPGGLTRERAGFEVRDVHASHYGRICPIETPEGPNIGLISSLSTFAKVSEYGFIQTPYRVVKGGKVTSEIVYMNALEEEEYIIAQANAPLDEKGRFTAELVSARHRGEFFMVERDNVQLMDVSPAQLVSVSASLIPFLEHDDANRALMGSNMQRQAVPLIRTTAPIVGTGLESTVAKDSGVTVIAEKDGIVDYVDSSRVVVRSLDGDKKDGGVDIYNLIKFQRSNQNTCWNQRPFVRKGHKISKGQVIADGPSTDHGELALGQNVLVAFMPWGGYNFEDAILISERLVKEDQFTSIHIEEFECIARETKLGREEITRDIPNVSEDTLRNLDESGIIRIGADVKPGDILVGKISPKGETQLSPEERLLRAIFGDKAGDVKDSSLRANPGVYGTVIDVKMLISRMVDKDERAKSIEDFEVARLKQDRDDEVKIIREGAIERIKSFLAGRVSAGKLTVNRKTVLKKDDKITEEILDSIPFEKLAEITVEKGETVESEIKRTIEKTLEQQDLVKMVYDQKINKLVKPDELPPGVLKIVKVYIAVKRKLQVGDKMAGRHGNKGVVSKIMLEEDMPYLPDGTPVDMVLNPLGVPSRMNIGQILETHLGWAAQEVGRQLNDYIEKEFSPAALRKKLKEIYRSQEVVNLIDELSDEEAVKIAKGLWEGVPIESPVFDGASEKEIKDILKAVGLPSDGKAVLFDGLSGEPFDQKVTVGVMYMLKLHHLVEDKIHARAIGPYSLVTQQPLGGKAHFGGQRLGEMEVWALEAYGAAYTLQEFLNVKSDDVIGRTRIFDSIVKGEMNFEPGLPESFKVLVKELQALGLDINLIENHAEERGELQKTKAGGR